MPRISAPKGMRVEAVVLLRPLSGSAESRPHQQGDEADAGPGGLADARRIPGIRLPQATHKHLYASCRKTPPD
ncbi:hypothetical protein a10_00335 [Streptomyces acidiscabies]|nr:hypothetical protein a10_00335 [Streptomyces acidiscabies]